MKTKLYILAFILTACNFTTNAQVTGSYVPAYQQIQSNWCWACTEQMLYWAYKPGSISQCTAVNQSRVNENIFFIGTCNNLPTNGNPCTTPAPFNNPQSMYGCLGSIESVMDSYGVGSTGYGYAFSSASLAAYLSLRRITVARWGWNGGGGHFVVVNRYKNGYVYFNNPSNGSAFAWTYNTFKTANSAGTWTHTLPMDGSAVYGSIYYRTSAPKSTVSEVTTSLSINAYPNPCVNTLHILLNGDMQESKKLTVVDVTGKSIYTSTINNDMMGLSINVSNWAKGMYLVKVDGIAEAKQIVVQ